MSPQVLDSQPEPALAAGEPGGPVQQLIAQRLRLRLRQAVGVDRLCTFPAS
jgi:hypothetical protein